MSTLAAVLHAAVSAVAPITGVAMVDPADPDTWRIDFADGATDGERAAAAAVVAAFDPDAPTPADVAAERDRRLAGGFSYDFGDARGVHVFATTEADLRGWRDVSDYAAALRANGDTMTTIAILTETGATAVTAADWADILIAAAAFRQPIWAASFALQAMDPIPADYADDSRWP